MEISSKRTVIVRNACKKYGNGKKGHNVFQNMDIDVHAGTIYALLGESGSGKTTLLTCLLGMRNLDSGQITVFGCQPGTKGCGVPGHRVGYMPQETSLIMTFCTREMMVYFGRLYGMSDQSILDRMGFMATFLKLPSLNRTIHTLSGGQQRRVSLAIAFLHDPQLLILDEPTVGVDTLLRQTIWDHLRELTMKKSITIIITTHYTEEAARADVVGFMRNGRLLAQDTPKGLLRRYGQTSLESVFFSLCQEGDDVKAAMNATDESLDQDSQFTDMQTHSPSFKNHIEAIIYRNIRRVRHNAMMSLSFVVSPIIMMCVGLLVMGANVNHLNFGVVNHEWPQEPICKPYDDCLLVNLSCSYLAHLDHELFSLEAYPDESSALQAVENGKAWGYISFPANYSDSLAERIWDINAANESILKNSVTTVKLDNTIAPLSLRLQQNFLQSFEKFNSDMMSMCHAKTEVSKSPIQFANVLGPDEPTFQHFLLPGLLSNMVFELPVNTVFCLVIMDRTEGIMARTWTAGVSDAGFLVSEFLLQLTFLVLQLIPLLPFMYWCLDIVSTAVLKWFVVLLAIEGVCSVTVSLFLAMHLPSITVAGGVSLAISLALWILSGAIWPLEAISVGVLKVICWTSPVTWFAEAYRDVLIRGHGITHSTVMYTCAYAAILTVVSFLGVIVTFRYQKFKYVK